MRILPRNWKCLRLEEVCSFHRGLTYKKKDEVDFSQNAVLRANNVSLESGRLDLTEIRYIDDQIRIPPEKKVRKGSLLVCMASGSKKHLGKVALIDEDYGYAFGGFMGLLLPNAIVYPKYLYWITQSKDYSDYIIGLSDGANINNLKFSQLGKYQVPLPPLPEQKRIVAILDEAFAGIDTAVANTEKNLANAREFFESYLNAVFIAAPNDWADLKLSDICTIKHGFAFKSKYFSSKGAHVVLTPGSFFESGGFRDQGPKTKYYNGQIPQEFILDKGDFLIAMTEQAVGLLGSSLIVPEADRYLHNQRLGLVRVRDGFHWNNEFFFHQFNTRSFRESVQSTASGVKVRHTSPAKLGAIKVKYPPTKVDQESVARRLDELSAETHRLEGVLQKKVVALSELKQSLLQEAFSGELTAGKAASDAMRQVEEIA